MWLINLGITEKDFKTPQEVRENFNLFGFLEEYAHAHTQILQNFLTNSQLMNSISILMDFFK